MTITTKTVEPGIVSVTVDYPKVNAIPSRGWFELGDAITGSPESQHFWLHLPGPWPADDFTREARQRGVVITSGREFAVARHDVPNAVRICLGPPGERQSLKRAITTLADILADTPQAFGTSV